MRFSPARNVYRILLVYTVCLFSQSVFLNYIDNNFTELTITVTKKYDSHNIETAQKMIITLSGQDCHTVLA